MRTDFIKNLLKDQGEEYRDWLLRVTYFNLFPSTIAFNKPKACLWQKPTRNWLELKVSKIRGADRVVSDSKELHWR